MNAPVIARWAVRVLGAVMVVLGLVVWTGAADALIPIHMLIGVVFVVALWASAYLGYRAGARGMLVALAVVLGVILPVVGATQEGLLTGSVHWVVQIVHLGLGVAAIGVGEALGANVERGAAAPA